MRQSALSTLSDRELLGRIQVLTRRERETTLDILLHLGEVERRKLHLSLGHSSLFDYCTRQLKYSASAACRRIQTARCIRRYPEVEALLRSDLVNLTTVSLVAPVLHDTNKNELLRSVRNKSQREVERIVSRYRPPIALRDRVKPVRVYVPVPGEAPAKPFAMDPRSTHSITAACEKSDYHRSGGDGATTYGTVDQTSAGAGGNDAREMAATQPATRTEQKLLVQFLASEAFMKQYEEVCSLLSNRLPQMSFEKVFELLIGEYLDRQSPRRREARRENRRDRLVASGRANNKNAAKPGRSRSIPAAVRDKVFIRDGGRCTYIGSNGRRCRSTRGLQIDHVTPFARGGKNNASNLRVLCARHNRLEAEKAYGGDFMKRFCQRE